MSLVYRFDITCHPWNHQGHRRQCHPWQGSHAGRSLWTWCFAAALPHCAGWCWAQTCCIMKHSPSVVCISAEAEVTRAECSTWGRDIDSNGRFGLCFVLGRWNRLVCFLQQSARVFLALVNTTCPVGNIADIELPRLGLRFKAGSQANGRGGLECMGFSGLCLKLRLIACPVIDVPIWTSYIQLYPVIRQDHTEHPTRLMNARALKWVWNVWRFEVLSCLVLFWSVLYMFAFACTASHCGLDRGIAVEDMSGLPSRVDITAFGGHWCFEQFG